MSERVSDKRLAELIEIYSSTAHSPRIDDTEAALRELQQWRAAVLEHNAGTCEECYQIEVPPPSAG